MTGTVYLEQKGRSEHVEAAVLFLVPEIFSPSLSREFIRFNCMHLSLSLPWMPSIISFHLYINPERPKKDRIIQSTTRRMPLYCTPKKIKLLPRQPLTKLGIPAELLYLVAVDGIGIKIWTQRSRVPRGDVKPLHPFRNSGQFCSRSRQNNLHKLSHQRFRFLAYPLLLTILWRKTSEVWDNP